MAEIQVNLAAVVPLGKHQGAVIRPQALALLRRPIRPRAAAITGLAVLHRAQGRLRVGRGRHGLDDIDQGGEGVAALRGFIGQQAIGRSDHDRAVGAALAAIHQQGLRQQGYQRALAVPHDGDGFIRGQAARFTDKHGQPMGGQDEIAAVRVGPHEQGVGQRQVGRMPGDLAEALAEHLQQVVGGIGEKPAALGEVAVQTIVENVLILGAQLGRVAVLVAFYLVGRSAIPPVERDETTAGGFIGAAFVEVGVGVVEPVSVSCRQAIYRNCLCRRKLSAITSRAQIRSMQPLVQALKQSRFHRLIRGTWIVNAMQENHDAGHVAWDGDQSITRSVGDKSAAVLGDNTVVGVAHF